MPLQLLRRPTLAVSHSQLSAGGNQSETLAQIRQLMADNQKLNEELQKIKNEAVTPSIKSQGSFTTVHVPGQPFELTPIRGVAFDLLPI